MKVKAKCPYCDHGCDKCADGIVTTDFGGSMWVRRCRCCNRDYGGRIVGHSGKPVEKPGSCVFCDGAPLEWAGIEKEEEDQWTVAAFQ